MYNTLSADTGTVFALPALEPIAGFNVVSQITLGNIYQSGGKTVVGGSQSGLDTEGIIKALVEAKRLPAVQLETKNKSIDSKLTAYNDLKTLLTKFQTSVDALRNPPGVQNDSQNIFQYRNATLLTNTGLDASGYATMTVQPGAAVQTFTINEVEQLAREAKQASGTFTLADTTTASVVSASGVHTAGQFSAGTFSLRNINPASADVDITLTENDSLQAVVNKFNAVKDRTGIQANILKVSSGSGTNDYKIVFTSTSTGTDYDFNLATAAGPAATLRDDPDGVLSMIQGGMDVPQEALNAKLTVDGVSVERQTNSVSDLIDGITFTLKQTTPALTTIKATVQPDTSIVQNALTSFVDAYNAFKLFASKQQEIGDDGLPTEDAVLANESQLRSIISQVNAEVTSVIKGITGSDLNRLADIGIEFSDYAGDDDNPATKNIMTIDTDKLSSALASDFDGLRSIFEFQLNADDPNLTVFKRTNGLAISDFTLSRNGSGVYQATYTDALGSHTIDLDSSAINGGGVTLKGKSGTVLDGLQLIYAGDTTTFNDIDVNITQGFGDRLYNLTSNMLDATSGSLTNRVTELTDQETRNKKSITTIDDQLETYRQQLTDQYATLEAALSKANNLLSLLDAQASAREANG